jgi:hypothetical protein
MRVAATRMTNTEPGNSLRIFADLRSAVHADAFRILKSMNGGLFQPIGQGPGRETVLSLRGTMASQQAEIERKDREVAFRQAFIDKLTHEMAILKA